MAYPEPKDVHDIEQSAAAIREQFCPVLFSVYGGFISAGFDKEQAFELTKIYLSLILEGMTPPTK